MLVIQGVEEVNFNSNFLINLLNKEINLGFIKKDIAQLGLFISTFLLLPLVFLLPIVLVGIIGFTLAILSSFYWGFKGGVSFGFWLVGILVLGVIFNPAVFDPVTTPINIGGAFIACLIMGQLGEVAKKNREKLKQKNNLLDGILESIQDGISVLGSDLTVQYTNETMKQWYQENLPFAGKKCFQVYHNRDNACDYCPTLRCLETGQVEVEEVYDPINSEVEWIEIFSYPMINSETESVTGVVEFVRDITERKQAKQKIEQLVDRQKLLLNNIEIQIWYLDDPETYGAVNQAYADFIGLPQDKIKNKTLWECLPTEKEVKNCIAENKKIFKEKHQIHTETEFINYQGESRLLSITKTPKLDDTGAVEYVICSAVDITEQKKAEERIKYISFHDELTDLYNRAYVEEEMERLDTDRQLPISIIMVDVNGLKLVNDTFGHETGDELLIKTAEVLQQSCREEDIIARFGGDEFIILLPQTGKQNVTSVVNRIKQNCREISLNSVPLSIALGSATKENSDQNLWEICKDADERMYDNKLTESRSAKNNIVRSLLDTLEEKSSETAAHAMQLQKMSFELGGAVDLSMHELDRLSLVATLHDIGKVTISEEILTKSASLDEEEWSIIKEHPKAGYRIASSTDEFAHVANAILHHHERWDGAGYPEGLEKDQIPFLSRIIAIIDAYDVMISGRPYKSALTKEEAKQELKECAGGQFDPQLIEVFLDLLNNN